MRALTLALLLATSAAALAPALAGPLPRLRASVTVEGEALRLSDLIEGAGPAGEAAVFRAPEPGAGGTVMASRIAQAAREAGIASLDLAGLASVRVARAGRVVPADAVLAALREALAAEHNVVEALLDVDGGARGPVVEVEARGAPQVRRLSYERATGRFEAEVVVPGSRGLERAPFRLSGVVSADARVPVLTRAVLKGDVVTPADVAWEHRRRADLPADLVTEEARLVGYAARRPLRAGSGVREGDLARPELVERGAAVVMTYGSGPVSLSLKGKAMASGARGDVIQVMNPASKRVVEATVTGPGTVRVAGPSPLAPARVAASALAAAEEARP